jgi:hypothetical protein
MKLGIREIYDAARAAGFTPDQATTWTAIAMAESGGETGAHNPNGEDSRGLWQINIAPGVRQNVWGDLSDPYVNARAAYDISNHGLDMRPWTTTHASHAGTATDYRTYLDDVSAVTGYTGDPRGVEGYGSPLPDPLPPSGPDPALTTTSYDAIDLGMQPGSNLDSDSDGLTDAFELMSGSSPDVADTDQDGLSDAYEAGVSHTSPLLADTDADTLSDAAETALGTAPTMFDTDLDGASDGLEVQEGFDPLKAEGGVDPAAVAAAAAAAAGRPVNGTVPGTGATGAAANFQGQDPWGKVTINGETVDNFTAAALQVAASEAGTDWRILQGSFSHDVAASGSTHSGGGVIDIAPTNGDWEGAVTALRKIGFAAWIRNVPGHGYAGSGEHIHAVLMGDEQLSDQAAIQVQSYLNNDNGLAGSAPDDGPRQFVNNRFSWEDATGMSAGAMPGPTDGVAPTATFAAYDQIDAGLAPTQVGDTDGDGLSDVFEQTYGLDPVSADSDRDGRLDGIELLQGTNPRAIDGAAVATAANLNGLDPAGDEDGDSLRNAFEVEHGLDPRLSDTDQDGLTDAAELALGTNPLAVDSDLDGFTDRAELDLGTEPLGTEPTVPALSDLDPAGGDDGLT